MLIALIRVFIQENDEQSKADENKFVLRGGIDLTVEYLYKCRCCGEVFTDVIEDMTKPQLVAILDNYCNDKASDFPNKTVCCGCNNIRNNDGDATYGIADFIGMRAYEKD